MKKIFILYPAEFTCFGKFSRKTSNIVSNLSAFEVFFVSDPNGFIKQYFSSMNEDIVCHQVVNWRLVGITHAILFDDGEVFPNELATIEELAIPFRFIKIKITRVVNIKKERQYADLKKTDTYEYIGRGSYWGNPYSMYGTGDDREEVIRKFKYDFDFEKFPNKKKSEVFKLAGKRLGCFCKPEKCHGDILAEYLNSWDDGL